MPAAFDLLLRIKQRLSFGNKDKPKVKGGGQECPPHTVLFYFRRSNRISVVGLNPRVS